MQQTEMDLRVGSGHELYEPLVIGKKIKTHTSRCGVNEYTPPLNGMSIMLRTNSSKMFIFVSMIIP